MEKNWPNVYKELGIKPVINARSWVTIFGGSIMKPEVIKSIEEASSVFIDLEELHEAAGKFVSKVCGSEMAIVTSGCAASIVLMTAACITGKDQNKISKIPHTEGMKNEILIHKGQRNNYDTAFETPGGKLIEYDNKSLEKNINDKTCAVAYVIAPFFDEGLGLKKTIEVAHKHNLPVILDAAAELPPRENLNKFISMGVDAVGFSGGKGIGGPQSTGILAGKKDLIEAAQLHSFQNLHTTKAAIGRPMKVTKENIIGFITALKLFIEDDEITEKELWYKKAQLIKDKLKPKKGIKIHIDDEYPNRQGPTVVISFMSNYDGPRSEKIMEELSNKDPKIFVGGGLNDGHAYRDEIYIVVHSLEKIDIDIISDRLNEIISG
jgi:L-seryl-tRNA(Ser) seleniumtransferase|tara:strand:- start:882 stop:2018 length:1137 start_codon:yes stop_codon:yes gene_type:complete